MIFFLGGVVCHSKVQQEQVGIDLGKSQALQVQNAGLQSIWYETKTSDCPSWSGLMKHVEDVYYLHNKKILRNTVANPKAHWDNLEERKARKHAIETKFQGRER